MKAMKKILFLTLIFALALTTVAFAATQTFTSTKFAEVSNWIEICENNADADGKFACKVVTSNCTGTITATWTPWADVQADCTLDATVNGKCDTCGTVWSGKWERTNTEHKFETVSETPVGDPATCITAGATKVVLKCTDGTCQATSETVIENKPAAYGHTLFTDLLNDTIDDQSYDASKPMSLGFATALDAEIEKWNANYATYTSDASYQFQGKNLKSDFKAPVVCENGYIKITCDHCKEVLFEQEFAGEHDWQHTANYVGAFPTCDTPGEMYFKCAECGELLKVYLPAYGHSSDPMTLYIRQGGKLVAATSKNNVDENGKILDVNEVDDLYGKEFVECEVYQLVHACERPNMTLEALTLDIEAYLETLKDLPPHLKTSALVEALANAAVKIESCDHIEYTFGAKVLPALWDHVYDLNNLNKEYNEFSEVGEFDGNCFEPSHYYLTCNGCDWSEKIVGADPSHKWEAMSEGTVIEKATCSKNGTIELECTVDNCEGKKTVSTEKLAHTLAWHHSGTCYEAGYLTEKCNVCGEVVQRISVDAWHDPAARKYVTNYGTNVEKIGTVNQNGLVLDLFDLVDCTKDGAVKYFCDVCDKNITETIKATGHIYNLEKVDLDKNGKVDADEYIVVKDAEKLIAGNKFDDVQDGIVQPTCSTYGYIYLQCTNPNCDKVEKIKNADKLAHFTKLDTAEGEVIVPSTCTEVGTVTKTCLCGKTETTELAKLPHTPTKVDGKDVCAVCGTELKLDSVVKFNIQTSELTVTSTSVSGRGVIDQFESIVENTQLLHKNLYARLNYNFRLDDGNTYAYIACVEVDKDGSFRVASPACPYGATLDNFTIMITTDEDAQDKYISEVVNLGVVVVK